MLDGTLRVRFKDRDLAFTPFKTLTAPPPVEDDKTLDARLDAVIARNAPSPTGRPRKGVDNGLARYGAMEGALRQAVIHPHSTHSPLSERGHIICYRHMASSPPVDSELTCPVRFFCFCSPCGLVGVCRRGTERSSAMN